MNKKINMYLEFKIKKGNIDRIFLDDIVMSDDDGDFHLDIDSFDYDINRNENILCIKTNSLGTNWDELNEENGVNPNSITPLKISKSTIDTYVVFEEFGSDTFFELKKASVVVAGEWLPIKISKDAISNAREDCSNI